MVQNSREASIQCEYFCNGPLAGQEFVQVLNLADWTKNKLHSLWVPLTEHLPMDVFKGMKVDLGPTFCWLGCETERSPQSLSIVAVVQPVPSPHQAHSRCDT
jgi:hypothetical protein